MRSHLTCAAVLGAISLAAAPGTAAASCDAPLETPPDVYALLEALLADTATCADPGPDEAFDAMVDLAMTSCPIGWDCEPRATPPPGEPVTPPLVPTVVVDPPVTGPTPPITVIVPPAPPIVVVYPTLPPDTLPPPITIEPPPPIVPPPGPTEPITSPPPPEEADDCLLGTIRIRADASGEPIAADFTPCGEATYDWWFAAPWIVVADDTGPFVPIYRVDPTDGLAIIASHNQAAMIAQHVLDAEVDPEHLPVTTDLDPDPVPDPELDLETLATDRALTHVLIDSATDGAVIVLTGGE